MRGFRSPAASFSATMSTDATSPAQRTLSRLAGPAQHCCDTHAVQVTRPLGRGRRDSMARVCPSNLRATKRSARLSMAPRSSAASTSIAAAFVRSFRSTHLLGATLYTRERVSVTHSGRWRQSQQSPQRDRLWRALLRQRHRARRAAARFASTRTFDRGRHSAVHWAACRNRQRQRSSAARSQFASTASAS